LDLPDTDPKPQDSYVCRPSGSGSFHHQAKIIRKTLISISTVL
jgi:hypothetical protein